MNQCKFCQRFFASKYTLNRHIQGFHRKQAALDSNGSSNEHYVSRHLYLDNNNDADSDSDLDSNDQEDMEAQDSTEQEKEEQESLESNSDASSDTGSVPENPKRKQTEKLEKYIDLLELLLEATPHQRKLLIEMANGDFLSLISDCCLNVLNGNVPLEPTRKKRLRKYAPTMRQLISKGDRNKSLKQKRKLMLQHGGFLPALLAPIVGLAGGIIGELTGRNL